MMLVKNFDGVVMDNEVEELAIVKEDILPKVDPIVAIQKCGHCFAFGACQNANACKWCASCGSQKLCKQLNVCNG